MEPFIIQHPFSSLGQIPCPAQRSLSVGGVRQEKGSVWDFQMSISLAESSLTAVAHQVINSSGNMQWFWCIWGIPDTSAGSLHLHGGINTDLKISHLGFSTSNIPQWVIKCWRWSLSLCEPRALHWSFANLF